ncbi:MAG: CNNM domain-containing protein [Beijerinckiaceae bacterium]
MHGAGAGALIDVLLAIGVLFATGLMTVILLIFAELMPKTVAINYPDRASLLVARVISFFVAILGPVLFGGEIFVRGCLKAAGIDTSARRSILSGHEELKSAVDLLHREGGAGRSGRDMFAGLLDLRYLEVSYVMVHRTKSAPFRSRDRCSIFIISALKCCARRAIGSRR